MLTAKQEKFVQNIVKGMSQIDAYRDAYNADGMSDNAVSREASLLMKNPKISQRHKELGEDTRKSTIMTAQERLEYLSKIIQDEEKEKILTINNGEEMTIERPADLNTKMIAIDFMNKMLGEYVTKIAGEITVKLEDLI